MLLITGGAGYIGSHTAIELLQNNYKIAIIDNFSNSKPQVIENIKKITKKNLKFYNIDILSPTLEKVFQENSIQAVLHFAGLKAVGESVEEPLLYYHNNISGSINLFSLMQKYNIKKIVFSSSATVYSPLAESPLTEDMPTAPNSPYGNTKLIIENILRDIYTSDPTHSIALLRYFNPIGAHESGLIGDDPSGIPNNLMPYITRVASGSLKTLKIFGNDYNTPDGTGIRDYIHIKDLAHGHLKALQKILSQNINEVYNLGTGKGYSVFQILKTFQKVNNIKIPYEITPRRPGDIATCYADPQKAHRELSWKAQKTIEDMVRDAWNWERKSLTYSKKQ